MTSFDALIWDCDGCLVDSEVLSCEVMAGILTDFGCPIEARAYMERFAGGGLKDNLAVLQKETGLPVLDAFPYEEGRKRRNEVFARALKPVTGIHDALARIDIPMCIASGSDYDRLSVMLKATRLNEIFEGRVYSSVSVARGKPAPDVFLYAAAQMGAVPARCLVIEDSANGLRAAQAAGMTAYAFTGGSHINEAWVERLRAVGAAAFFDDMRALPEMLKAA